MKAISLYPPWSVWVLFNWKTIETRNHDRFKSLIGQRIAIHSSLKVDMNAFFNPWIREKTHSIATAINQGYMVDLSKGKLICTAMIESGCWAPDYEYDVYDQWNLDAMIEIKGRYCLLMKDIRPVWPMIPFRGRQGIFEVPDELILKNQRGRRGAL